MSAITESASGELLERTRAAAHPACVVCGLAGRCGLGLRFEPDGDGGVAATFECSERFQGYRGVLHGGVIASLLDGAMTNCLFARGLTAVTAEMTVRYRHPVDLRKPLRVSARIVRAQGPLYVVEAGAFQAGVLKAKASGKFMERPGKAAAR